MAYMHSEIASNPFIQNHLMTLSHADLWVDALTAVLFSGSEGISPDTLAKRIMSKHKARKHPLSLSVAAHQIAETIAEEFRPVVRQDHRNRLFWREPESDINSIDPAARNRMAEDVLTISATHEAMSELAKENGFFELPDVISLTAKRLSVPEDTIADRVSAIVAQSRFMYSKVQGIMRPRDANPLTRRQNMVMFELLVNNPRGRTTK